MTGTMVLVLALCIASFAAGWFARGSDLEEAKAREARRGRRRRGRRADEQPTAEAVADVMASAPPGGIAAAGSPVATAEIAPLHAAAEARSSEVPRAGDVALRALDLATSAYEHAVDRWLDEGGAITPAGRASLGELDRAIRRLDLAIGRLDAAPGDHQPEAAEARIAIAALRDAAALLAGYRDGRAIDGATDRQLRELEDEVAQARTALAGAIA